MTDAAFWQAYGNDRLEEQLKRSRSHNSGIAKNVIIFVGDGMGIQTGTMGRIYKGQKAGRSGEEERLVWEEFPTTGLSKV